MPVSVITPAWSLVADPAGAPGLQFGFAGGVPVHPVHEHISMSIVLLAVRPEIVAVTVHLQVGGSPGVLL